MFNEAIAELKGASLETKFPEAFITGTLFASSIVNHTLDTCCEKEKENVINIMNAAIRFPIEFLIGKNTNAPGLGAAKSRASFFGSVNCAQFKQGEAIGFLTIEKTESVSIKEVGI